MISFVLAVGRAFPSGAVGALFLMLVIGIRRDDRLWRLHGPGDTPPDALPAPRPRTAHGPITGSSTVTATTTDQRATRIPRAAPT